MNDLQVSNINPEKKAHTSKGKYIFYEEDPIWRLDKNTKIYVGATLKILNGELRTSYIDTLVFFARNLSSWHTRNINDRFVQMLKKTNKTTVEESMLINYKASLNRPITVKAIIFNF